MSGGIRVQNVQALGLTPSNGFLKTALDLSTSLQNVTDNAGNASGVFISNIGFNNRAGTNSSDCTVFGEGALATQSIAGKAQTAYGRSVLAVADNTSERNCGYGAYSLTSLISGKRNSSFGVFNSQLVTTQEQNCSFGYDAMRAGGNYSSHFGYGNWREAIGDYNTSIGYNCNRSGSSHNNTILIGINAYSAGNNSLNIGNSLYGTNINNGGYGTPGLNPQFAIGKTTPHASAIFDLNSTTLRGFLPPCMSTANRNLLSSPANGLQVYDTDLNQICFYSTISGGWRKVTDTAA